MTLISLYMRVPKFFLKINTPNMYKTQQKTATNTLTQVATLEGNLYFIRSERIYTKLKYSRVPAFDTASGALATLVSGFFGFLICERFGFELLDSGDFYVVFMYAVIGAFLSRTLLLTCNFRSQNGSSSRSYYVLFTYFYWVKSNLFYVWNTFIVK